MDLHKFTTAQLYIMHRAANSDARAAYALAEHKSIELLELAVLADNDTYAAVNAEFAVLMAQADDHRACSRQIYDEIVRRSQVTAETNCKDCRRRIYWVDDLSVWYHWNQADMLTCPASVIEPEASNA